MTGTVLLRADRLELELLPAIGGSIGRFVLKQEIGEVPLLCGTREAASPLEAACFPLVPYCNRVRGGTFTFRGERIVLAPNMIGDVSPLHGQGWLAPWQVQGHDTHSAELTLYHRRGEWPWRYRAVQRFALDERGFRAELQCTNEDERAMPCGLGFHPYFPCTADTRLRTAVETVWEVDEDILPTARIAASGFYDLSEGAICGRGLDNGFGGWKGDARIDMIAEGLALRLASPDAHFFQVYAPAEGGLFAAEPVSHANAALNEAEEDWPALGLQVLDPGETMTLAMRLEMMPPDP